MAAASRRDQQLVRQGNRVVTGLLPTCNLTSGIVTLQQPRRATLRSGRVSKETRAMNFATKSIEAVMQVVGLMIGAGLAEPYKEASKQHSALHLIW